MPDRRSPNPRSRDGLLPPVGARTPGLDDLDDDTIRAEDDGDWDDDEWYEPNYMVRRALAIGGTIAAIAIIVFVVSKVIGGDDGGSGSASAASAEWNHVVVLTDDEIRIVDPSNGDVVDTYDGDADLLDAQSVVTGNVLVTMTDAGRITQTDLSDGTSTRGRASTDQALRLSTTNPTIAIAGTDGGGDVTLIDTNERTTLRVGDVAGLDDPLIFPMEVYVNPDGTHAAMSDARSFQSTVVDIAEGTAELLAGQVVAIGDDRVVTAQRAGANTELEFYDLAGERLGSVDVPTPAASLLTSDGNMLLVDASGAIRLANADGDVSELGALSDTEAPTATIEVEAGTTAFGGTRLLAITSRQVFVLNDAGLQLGVADGDITSTPTRASRCVTVGSPRSTGTSVQLDLDNASVIVEIGGGIVSNTSVDGCTAALIGGASPQIVHDGEIIEVDANSIVDIAPDGEAYVVLDGRDSELLTIDGESNVEVADVASVIRFAQR
ncbi:hypothetical protein [Ilumatobacter coccineus]|uniref:Uncharacterized protein n=1 Tax=Ilumatobacter coccineus (strain NBRC 103263 / KCTC 29153 / YM16-304) TaxID=1313172 RepID=A0A6C7DZN5_ILUCY|nr:hypothetical protein [Ilumatobacter coccineus]BAN00340.1 hypothetical protein YM304_00260 [Ilumatobacter coccineus YM16-304]